MIIIGYPGVGKSTASGSDRKFIDFDSSLVPKEDGWEVPYVKVATQLSKDGYIVFVSSHKSVQELLKECGETVVVAYPSLLLHDFWIDKLRARYDTTHRDSDLRALRRCVSHYCEDILELGELPFIKVEIESEDYVLMDEIYAKLEEV